MLWYIGRYPKAPSRAFSYRNNGLSDAFSESAFTDLRRLHTQSPLVGAYPDCLPPENLALALLSRGLPTLVDAFIQQRMMPGISYSGRLGPFQRLFYTFRKLRY